MVEIVAAGIHSTIQDQGRFGFRHLGVPVSGSMDRGASDLANRLVNNSPDAAVLEFVARGPILKFLKPCIIAVTGAGFKAILNNTLMPLHESVTVEEGSILSLGTPSNGWYGYLAVAGGFASEKVLSSYSYYKGITNRSVLKKGITLDTDNLSFPGAIQTTDEIIKYDKAGFVEVYPGPEYGLLSDEVKKSLMDLAFNIAAGSNRMAVQLECDLSLDAPEIITAPVQPGTVQLTPSGKILVLMRDAQTTGGYARILQLKTKAIDRLAQCRPNTQVRFRIIDLPSDIHA